MPLPGCSAGNVCEVGAFVRQSERRLPPPLREFSASYIPDVYGGHKRECL